MEELNEKINSLEDYVQSLEVGCQKLLSVGNPDSSHFDKVQELLYYRDKTINTLVHLKELKRAITLNNSENGK